MPYPPYSYNRSPVHYFSDCPPAPFTAYHCCIRSIQIESSRWAKLYITQYVSHCICIFSRASFPCFTAWMACMVAYVGYIKPMTSLCVCVCVCVCWRSKRGAG